jgi:hypothetical protein
MGGPEVTSGSETAATTPCPFCGGWANHSVEACPQVAEIEYFQNGGIKRVVKMRPQPMVSQLPSPPNPFPWAGHWCY